MHAFAAALPRALAIEPPVPASSGIATRRGTTARSCSSRMPKDARPISSRAASHEPQHAALQRSGAVQQPYSTTATYSALKDCVSAS
eukprot:9626-Heterococcus_DN1.PRE.2